MTNDAKDRHVLAAAVRCGAHAIITSNVKHFPNRSAKPYDLDVLAPGDFLVRQAQQFHLNSKLVREKPVAQAAARNITLESLLDRLERWVAGGIQGVR